MSDERNNRLRHALSTDAQLAGREADPIAVLLNDHAATLALCDTLERVADSLPHDVDQGIVVHAVKILQTSWAAHTAFKDAHLLPMLRKRAASNLAMSDILDQLQSEHQADVDVVQEVILALEGLNSQPSIEHSVATGYLLRSFFEGQRRHIIWERVTAIPFARLCLTAADVKELVDALERLTASLLHDGSDADEIADKCEGCGACSCETSNLPKKF